MASASALPNLYQGVDKQSFGYKLLANFGWKEGQGLGANKQGIKEHVKVKKKQDALGVGAAEQAHKLRDWTTGMVGYDAILTGLKEVTRAPGSSTDGSAGDSSDSSSSAAAGSSGYSSDSDATSDEQERSAAAAAAAAGGGKKKNKSKAGSKQQAQQVTQSKPGTAALAASVDCGSGQGRKKRKQQAAEQQVAAAAGSSGGDKAQKANAAKKRKTNEEATSGSGAKADNTKEGSTAAHVCKQDSNAAATAVAVASVSRSKAATHLGRYQRREAAKTVRNYSANDLAAILGLPGAAPTAAGGEGAGAWAAAVAAPAAGGTTSSNSSSDGDGDDDDDDDSDNDGEAAGAQVLRPGTPPGSDSTPGRPRHQHDAAGSGGGNTEVKAAGHAAADAAGCDATDVPASSWWRSVFVKSGGAGAGSGSSRPGKASINISGFQEADQANLYMQVHEGATKNKQGLGRSGMPKKVAGARWMGKKTRLGSDSEDEETESQQKQKQQQQQQQRQQQQHDDRLSPAALPAGQVITKNGIVIIMPAPRKQQQQQQQEQQTTTQGRQKESIRSKVKKRKGNEQLEPDAVKCAAGSDGKLKTKQQQQQQQQTVADSQQPTPKQAAAQATAGSCSKKGVKWAKLAAKILEGAPRKRMRVKKLHAKIVAAAGYDIEAPGVDTEQLFQQVLKKLRKAEGLAVCDKYVGLSAAP